MMLLPRFLLCVFSCSLAYSGQNVFADILLPKIFCDHMVLQRNATVPVSGTAVPGQKLELTFNDQQFPATADEHGQWTVMLPTGAAGGPYQIDIAAADSEAKLVVSDVMVGDVWLCSGQSNMQWTVSKALNPETEIEQSKNFPRLRLFRVEPSVAAAPESEFQKVEPWQVCSPDSVHNFSAAAYFFGRELNRNMEDVPFGLISSAVGGTPCEAWTSQNKIDSIDSLQPLVEHWNANSDMNSTHRPANLFNAMIAPLGDFPIRGVIWYQGEANVGRGAQYRELFPALIADWRQLFERPELPFYFAQLAPYRYSTLGPESLPEIWEAQLQTCLTVPGTGMAILTDIGDPDDIHPKNKQEVGRRLALLAMGKTYASDLAEDQTHGDFTGPLYESATNGDDRIRISFSACQSGLKIAGDAETLTGFTICGEDKKFYPAIAKIVDQIVEVSAAEVPHPVAVRFAWLDTATHNLINGEGLPASPFRTDDFPVASVSSDF